MGYLCLKITENMISNNSVDIKNLTEIFNVSDRFYIFTYLSYTTLFTDLEAIGNN